MTTNLIPLSWIQPNPWQTRQGEPNHEYIKDLALDIAANGLLQTPIGRFAPVDGKPDEAMVQLAFGHNRLAAYRWLYDLRDNSDIPGDYSKLPVDIRELTDIQMADLAWAENDKRQDISPLERAMAIRKRIDDFGWTQQDIADHLRISQPRVSNALRLLDLPDDILQRMAAGEMSERAALSLLALYALPASLRDAGEKQAYGDMKPSSIVDQAISGASSDVIREHIERLVRNYSKDLHQAIWDLDYIFVTSEAISWPECRTCALRHKPMNVCTNPSCYEAKGRVWKADYLQQASQIGGILPLEPDISIYETTDLRYQSAAKPILSSGCENLRLAYYPHDNNSEFSLKDKGFHHALIICRQKNGHCSCSKGLEILEAQRRREEILAIQDTPKDEEPELEDDDETQDTVFQKSEQSESDQPEPVQLTASDLQELVKQEKRNEKEYKKLAKEAQEQAIEIVFEGLEADEPGAWRLVYNRIAQGESWKDRPDDPLEMRRGIAEKIINNQLLYCEPKHVPDLLKKLLVDAGLQTPVF